MEDINKASGEQRINSMGLLLGSIFCPPVALYMLYIIDKNLARINYEHGLSYKENFIFWILMTIVCGVGSLIATFQITNAFNVLWDIREGVTPQSY